MARISKKPVPAKVINRIFRLFFEIIARSQSNETFFSIIDDILTPTEKIIIAKRIGIIYLLIKSVDNKTITETLKVSSSTVATHALMYQNKDSRIKKLITTMLRKEKILGFMEDIFSDFFISSGVYIGHHKMRREQEQSKQERKILG